MDGHSHCNNIGSFIPGINDNDICVTIEMGNPRRDAFEYGALVLLAGSMAAAYGFLIAYASQRNPDGTRRQLPKVNLEEQVDLRRAWDDMKSSVSGISWDNSTLSRLTKPSVNSPNSGAHTSESLTPLGGNRGDTNN
ncbi:hypothetical protein ACHAWX_000954 [Stephanocyclus meneghinianus]